MKKTVIALAAVFILVVALQAVLLRGGAPLEALVLGRPVTAASYAKGREIYVGQGEEAARLMIKGVLMDSCLPGRYSSDFAIPEDMYFDWMEQAARMGANTISVYSMMDPGFYSALYRYNTGHERPLYLLQGVSAPDYNMNNAQDGYDGFYHKLLSDARDAVDAVHGNLILSLGRVQGSGNYLNDVSPWTIGYLLGSEWAPYTLAYTDHKEGNPSSYSGEYFMTGPDATASEAMFARLMDEITGYETRRYRQQRLVGFSNATSTNPLAYNEDVRMQLEKCVRLNASNVLPTGKALAGCFSGYFLRGETEDFMACLSNRDWQDYGDALVRIDPDGVYGGYVEFLALLHEMPVVITYGFSSARGSDRPEEPMTEAEQGRALVAYYQAFMEAGCQGAVIATWQDNWSRTTWNTMFAVDEESQRNWYDVQTVDNCYGLLAFDPGREESACYVDGEIGEWGEEDVCFAGGGRSISAKYDAAYLYLMVRGEREPLYIPIDVTPNSGSNSVAGSPARFGGFADFLLELNGEDARMLVQQRYDAAYMAFETRISGQNPFNAPPGAHTNRFGPIRHVLRNSIDPDAGLMYMDIEERAIFNRYGVRETGELRHGNANPSSPDYDSLADYCYGEGCVEIRIPWQMLNYSNPSEMKAHDDYYRLYGVEEIRTQGVSLGVGRQDSPAIIPMAWVELAGWDERVEYRQRLKQSYYIVQSAWAGGGQ